MQHWGWVVSKLGSNVSASEKSALSGKAKAVGLPGNDSVIVPLPGCLTEARSTLLDTKRNCVDRLHAVWPVLRQSPLSDIPISLRPDWMALSDRAARLEHPVEEPPSLARMDEAADIVTILVFFEWVLRHDLMSCSEVAFDSAASR
jgi:hypothetical protein